MRKRMIMMIMGVALMALPIMAQRFGTTQAEQPNTVFHSTSTMQGSGSAYSANPELNADGSATYEGASYTPAKSPKRPGGIRKDGPTPNPGDPSEGEQDNTPTPLGDAVLPLMLIACAYVCVRSFKKKRA